MESRMWEPDKIPSNKPCARRLICISSLLFSSYYPSSMVCCIMKAISGFINHKTRSTAVNRAENCSRPTIQTSHGSNPEQQDNQEIGLEFPCKSHSPQIEISYDFIFFILSVVVFPAVSSLYYEMNRLLKTPPPRI